MWNDVSVFEVFPVHIGNTDTDVSVFEAYNGVCLKWGISCTYRCQYLRHTPLPQIIVKWRVSIRGIHHCLFEVFPVHIGNTDTDVSVFEAYNCVVFEAYNCVAQYLRHTIVWEWCMPQIIVTWRVSIWGIHHVCLKYWHVILRHTIVHDVIHNCMPQNDSNTDTSFHDYLRHTPLPICTVRICKSV